MLLALLATKSFGSGNVQGSDTGRDKLKGGIKIIRTPGGILDRALDRAWTCVKSTPRTLWTSLKHFFWGHSHTSGARLWTYRMDQKIKKAKDKIPGGCWGVFRFVGGLLLGICRLILWIPFKLLDIIPLLNWIEMVWDCRQSADAVRWSDGEQKAYKVTPHDIMELSTDDPSEQEAIESIKARAAGKRVRPLWRKLVEIILYIGFYVASYYLYFVLNEYFLGQKMCKMSALGGAFALSTVAYYIAYGVTFYPTIWLCNKKWKRDDYDVFVKPPKITKGLMDKIKKLKERETVRTTIGDSHTPAMHTWTATRTSLSSPLKKLALLTKKSNEKHGS